MTDNKFNSFEYHPSYGGIEQVELTLDMYRDNNNLYMGMDYYDAELGGMDHFADITVNITDLPYLYSTVDNQNNGQKIIDFLVENGIAETTGLDMPSGYCLYPVMKFNAEALEKISPGIFRIYQQAHGIEPKQHGLDQVLMVIENYQGICEHNFLVTESWLHENNLIDDSQSPIEIKESLRSNWQADFYLRSDVSYLVKSCDSLDELHDFQNGAFNDHSQSLREDWYWDFQKERCTPEALQIVQKAEQERSAEKPELQSAKKDTKKASVDDLAKEAKGRAAKSNKERSHLPKTKEHKSPEMGR